VARQAGAVLSAAARGARTGVTTGSPAAAGGNAAWGHGRSSVSPQQRVADGHDSRLQARRVPS